MKNDKELNVTAPTIPAEFYSKETAQAIERKWRSYWYEDNIFKTENPKSGDKTFYCLDMFPYPSGYGLHVGHSVGYIASDVLSRFKRMQGFNVLHPMGWDAFGLPTERYAIKTGAHPSETTAKNAANYKRQMNLMGLSFDWSREFSTTDPSYYKWTQYIFLQLYNAWFDEKLQKTRPIADLPIPEEIRSEGKQAIAQYRDEHRLVYYADSMVNWSPKLNSVVANEEIMNDGRTEQGFEVIRVNMRQVMMRISAFAERLLAGLEGLDWPESIKKQQQDWIGRSEGVEIQFEEQSNAFGLTTFTTRPDTIFGVTFIAIAPEHELIGELVTKEQEEEVQAYVDKAIQQGERARKQQTDKTGVFTGAYVTNPLTAKLVPVFVADYVLMEHGTGVVMGVPAHDDRDFEFAQKYKLEVIPVFAPADAKLRQQVLNLEIPWTEDAMALDLDYDVFRELGLTGKSTKEVMARVTDQLVQTGQAKRAIHYKMRDWVFARQRYWGDPIPLINWEDGTVTGIPETELPLTLPEMENYEPAGDGQSALARATDWVNVTDPSNPNKKGKREVSTMPQWAGSCWYPLRFMDPDNENEIVDRQLEKAWGPVDFYIGGAEHATLHLLYSRFWYLALYDLGVIQTEEPFQKLFNQGMLTGFAYKTGRGVIIPIDDVELQSDGEYYIKMDSEHFEEELKDVPLEKVKTKMSKSLRNVVNPDDVIASYGADAFRLYIMFMAPVEGGREWETKNVVSTERFLRRFWNFVTGNKLEGYRNVVPSSEEKTAVKVQVNTLIEEIAMDCDAFKLNTAIAKIMKHFNEISKFEVSLATLEKMVLVVAPFAPFVAEELWQRLGHTRSLSAEPWPEKYADAKVEIQTITIVLTVNGKKRAELELDSAITEEALKARVAEYLQDTAWPIGDNDRIIIIKDKKTGQLKLVNVVKRK